LIVCISCLRAIFKSYQSNKLLKRMAVNDDDDDDDDDTKG